MAESGPRRELPPGAKPGAASQAGPRIIAPQTGPTTGILPIQVLRELLRVGEIVTATPLAANQLQPASLDLRLGAKAHRVRAGFLPGRRRQVAEAAAEFGLHEIDLTGGAVLETGCVYIVELQESLALSPALAGWANPKSSIGRLDVFVRLIVDHATEFDRVPAGYKGPLYAEISPQTFPVLVRQGSRLNQLRLGRGSPLASDAALRAVHDEIGLVGEAPGKGDRGTAVRKATLDLTIDLSGDPASAAGGGPKGGPGNGLVGFRAKRHTALIDVDRVGAYEPAAFWDPLPADPARRLILDPNEFYILRSREPVKVPPDYAAEMVAYDTQIGEFRAHYAGFFDPGFGYRAADGSRDNQGTRAVLEVRSHKVPFILEHGQIVGRLVYERMAGAPDELYGAGMGSSYQAQGLKLSKHFKAFSP